MTPEEIRNEKLAQKVIKGLKSRHFEAWYCPTKEEAKKQILSLIKKDDIIGWGGSATLTQIGVMDEIKNGSYPNIINRDNAASPEEKIKMFRQSLLSDTFLTGTNAITEDGELLNIDGNGNRVAAIAYGPTQVIVACGMNKVVPNMHAAYDRARNIAAPINSQRFEINTPCKITGSCEDCKSPDSICNVFVHTRQSRPQGRIKVILIGENLGF